MRPTHNVFENVISKPRLDSYKHYFKTKDVDEAIGLYMWNCELSACFSVLLSFFEIALRNNIHYAMSHYYSYGQNGNIHWYDKMPNLSDKQKSKVDEIRKEKKRGKIVLRIPAPNPDEIVSRVTFGFWSDVLGKIEPKYANQVLSKVFPSHPLSCSNQWNIKAKKTAAIEFIYELNDFRNRIAHHEPLWKFSAIKNTSNPSKVVVIEAESNSLEESLYRFARLLKFLDDAMEAMNPDFHADMQQSTWRKKLDYLLSERGISRYRSLNHCPDINQQPLTPLQFRKKFRLIMKKNKPIQVGYSNMKGVFIPE